MYKRIYNTWNPNRINFIYIYNTNANKLPHRYGGIFVKRWVFYYLNITKMYQKIHNI